MPYRALPNQGRRLSSSARGYGRDHRRTRTRVLTENPLCEDCLEVGRITPSNQLHHIRKIRHAPHQKHARENLRALCDDCHAKRTAIGE